MDIPNGRDIPDGPLALRMTPEELSAQFDRMMGTAHPLDVLAAAGTGRSKPPKGLLGYVQDVAFGSILYGDELETVVDVQWPQSVRIYAQMRRDAKLAAIEAGYALQLRRAQWQIDGTGCRPEVVQLVADDLGLPAKDQDLPGAARTTGVSWNDHLRSALGVLWAGHAGFEMEADTSSGQARLVGLWERPQHTIVSIHIEPKRGQFAGISQELARGPFEEPELKADRLVWYAHDPEAAGWFGKSLLRPAFAPWLYKREMMRILATSSRRFGMGVPTIEWAQGSTPTPEQFSAAQRAITAARVGDQAGATMPPGAMMKLVGLSGGTPDTLAFVQWLDQQMATSALMQHLDLGQTATGSRALGESFIDSWTLALEAIGEEIADAATRQIAARLVAWNWGDDEPVPRVVVSGIGTRRDITAQSLQMILSSGALQPYPELAEWVAREYRLPTPPRDLAVQNQAEFEEPPPDEEFAEEPVDELTQPVEASVPVRYEQPPLPLAVAAANPHWRDQPRWPKESPAGKGGQWRKQAGGASATVPTVRETTYTVTRRPSWRDRDKPPTAETRENLTIQGRVTDRSGGVLTIAGTDGQQARVFEPRVGQIPVGALVRLSTVDRQGDWAGIHTVKRDEEIQVLEEPAPASPRELGTANVDPANLPDVYELLDIADRIEEADRSDLDSPDFDVGEAVARLDDAISSVFSAQFAGYRTRASMWNSDRGELSVSGEILADNPHDPAAEPRQVGTFVRKFYRDGSQVVARHEFLELDPESQGAGFAREFNDYLFDWYRHSGVGRVALLANIDVGGYAWARQDYRFADTAGFRNVAERLIERTNEYEKRILRIQSTLASGAGDDAETLRAELDRLQPQVNAAWDYLARVGISRDDPDPDDLDSDLFDMPDFRPWVVSEIGRPLTGGGRDVQWLGKEVLLGSEWEGETWP